MILNQVADRVYTSVHGTAKIILITEILSARALLILCNVYCMAHQLINTLILCGRNRYNRHS